MQSLSRSFGWSRIAQPASPTDPRTANNLEALAQSSAFGAAAPPPAWELLVNAWELHINAWNYRSIPPAQELLVNAWELLVSTQELLVNQSIGVVLMQEVYG